ncbi:CoA ester lyase [Sphingobium sp. LB126]|uniref:HpcH/HpaI aldolase/citrate lyase family protein n=1 Tax=Sphingobium sp. LB126 TaxID=1983755 RepID=UPI000C20DC8B|nr:CoA ester lyase [Sphingobium sp. LB126]PJG46655.1 CoA ester lyase [Sphingobium sp. LB126]
MNTPITLSSLLFVPGSKPERYGKALASNADAVCIDLEDSVPAPAKGDARAAAIAAIAGGDSRLILRINGMTARAGLEDLLALADAPVLPSLILVPMVESPVEIGIIASVLGDRTPGIVPLIETVKGLRAAPEIAATPGVVAMMFGGGDFAAELGVALAWEPLRSARGAFVMACAGAAIPAIDVPFIAMDDMAGLSHEAAAAHALGFSGKAAIHPAQVDVINATFRPTAEQIAEAEEAQRVFDAAGGAAVRFNGRMLEVPIMRRYQRILAMRSKQDA